MRSIAPVLISAVVVALGITACSGDPLASPAPESSSPEVSEKSTEEPTDPELPTNEQLEEYVAAIASEKIATLQDAESLVATDSPAADYLRYYTHNVNAQIDGGLYYSDNSNDVEQIEGGFRVCADDVQERVCSDYTDFEGKDGLLVDFQIEGRKVSDRLVAGPRETVAGIAGSEIEFVSAYMNASDSHLIISYDMTSGDSELDQPLITYRGEDGRQSQAEDHYGLWTLAPDSKSSYVAFFPNASLGGEVHLDMWTNDPYDELTVVLPTAAD